MINLFSEREKKEDESPLNHHDIELNIQIAGPSNWLMLAYFIKAL